MKQATSRAMIGWITCPRNMVNLKWTTDATFQKIFESVDSNAISEL
jgi:hypothetical protein